LYAHLKNVGEVDSFYFNLLEKTSKYLYKQNAKRAILDSYLKILDFEGRLHIQDICFICEEKIDGSFALNRALLPSHTSCTNARYFNKDKATTMLNLKTKPIYKIVR